MKGPRTRFDFYEAETDPENPEGIILNPGDWLPLGNVEEVLNELGFPYHDLVIEYERFEAQFFRMGAETAEGLWRLPGWDITATTWFDEIPPFARRAGVEDLPFTAVAAFRRGEDGQPQDDDGRPLPGLFDWVMHGSHPQKA